MHVSTYNPTRSRTDCRWVEVGDVRMFFSYNTCLGVSYPGNDTLARRHNAWGPTTGKHINMANIRNWPVVDDEQFDTLVRQAFMHQGMEHFKQAIGG